MATEDFTGYTEQDTPGHISVTSTRVTLSGIARNEVVYAYKNFGASYFLGSGNWYAEGEFYYTSSAGSGACSSGIVFGSDPDALSSTNGDLNTLYDAAGMIFLVTAAGAATIYPYAFSSIAGSSGGSVAGAAINQSTLYYYRTGYLSSLGVYGGVYQQCFSDASRTTLVSVSVKASASALADFEYFMPAVSSNAGTTGALTGYNQNVELLQATSADIDLTNGIETDTGTGRLVVVANCIAATALNIANGEAAKHVAIDKGADFFGDYTVSGVLNIASFSNTTGTEKRFNILCVTDAAADAAAANDLQGIAIQNNTASVYSPYMHQAVAGVDTFSTTGGNLNFNQPYGFTMARSGSTRTMKIWNDLVLDANQQGTSQVGTTVTWTGQATTTYRYIMPVASHLNGATSKSATFTFGGLRLSGGVTTVAVGQASETDTAQAIAVSQGVLTVAVSQVAETDTAQAIIASQGITAVLGQVTESDLAQSIAMYAATTIAVGQATEVDVAQIILLAFAPQTVSVGQVAETDVAQVISSPTPITIALAQVSEIDLALAITRYDLLTVALGQASEIDLARSITVVFGLSETWSINLKHPTTGLALTGLGNTVVKFEAYQESTVDWFNSATGALQAAQPTPLALLEDVSGNHNGRYAAAATIGVFNTWMVLHIYWDYDAGDGRGVVRRHKWGRVYYNSGVELLPGMTVAQNTMLVTTIPAAIAALPTAAENATAILSAAQTTPIHADVKKVNAVTIQGAGVSGNSMRPV